MKVNIEFDLNNENDRKMYQGYTDFKKYSEVSLETIIDFINELEDDLDWYDELMSKDILIQMLNNLKTLVRNQK